MRLIGRFIWLLLLLIIIAGVASFVSYNRTPVTLDLWPLSAAWTTSIWVVCLSALAAGLLLGAAITWFASLPAYARLHKTKRLLQKTEARLAALEADIAAQPEQDAHSQKDIEHAR